MILLDGLGFGYANVVVAVPQAWIDVRSMADLDDVATAFRLRHNRKMRVATKYVNLTRDFFAKSGIADYRIVESLGATEGAPAAGTAELIVDITTTGNTLTANALKVIDDGVMLRSQANLVAARGADWNNGALDTARTILDRIAAQDRAHAFREMRTRFKGCDDALLSLARKKLRHRDAVWRPHFFRYADAALPARSDFRARRFPARQGRAGYLGLRDRLCVHAGQSAVRKAEGRIVAAKRGDKLHGTDQTLPHSRSCTQSPLPHGARANHLGIARNRNAGRRISLFRRQRRGGHQRDRPDR